MKKFILSIISGIIAFSLNAQFNQTSTLTCLPSPDGTTLGVTFNNALTPAADGELTFYYQGDIDNATEYIELFDENNTLIGQTTPSGVFADQCKSTLDSVTFIIPLADLQSWAADQIIDFTIDPQATISTTLCTPCTGGQLKLEYLSVSGANDAAVLSVDSPRVFCAGTQDVYATIGNFGTNQIDSVEVNWEVNGVAQPTLTYRNLLDTLNGTSSNDTSISLGSASFNAGANDIVVFTSNPNGVADTVNFNDTLRITVNTATDPTNFSVSNPTLTTVQATASGFSNSLDFQYGLAGFTLGSGTIVNTTTVPYTVTGLTQGSVYDIYVRSNCGAGDTSAWIGPLTFNTSYGVPFSQDFENFAAGITGNPWAEGWSSTTTVDPNWESEDATGNNENSANTGPLYDHTQFLTAGGIYIYMETSGGATGDSADFVSPPIFVDSNMSTVELTYWYFNYGADVDRMEVIIDTNGVEEVIATYVGQQQTAQTDDWLEASHFLSGYEGKSITLKFRGFNAAGFTDDLAIDDVAIDPVPQLNAGVDEILDPGIGGALCAGTAPIRVAVANKGIDSITSFSVVSNANGILDTTAFTQTILSGDSIHVNLNPNTFITGANNLSAYTINPNNGIDGFNGDDTLSIVVNTANPPNNFSAINVTLNSAGMMAGNFADSLEIEYGLVGFTQGTGTNLSSNTVPIAISGLTSGTSYDVYFRSICGTNDTSSWSGPFTFNTSYGIPYLQDFESFNAGITGNPWPEGWSSTTSADPNWESEDASGNNENSFGTGPLYDHTLFPNAGGTYVYMETSGGTTGDSADFVSPPIYIDTSFSTVELSYWYFNFGTEVDRMDVIVDTNGVEEVIATYFGSQQTTQADEWFQESLYLIGYEGKSVVLKFRGFNPPCCSGDLAIDDVAIDPVPQLSASIDAIIEPSGSLCGGSINPVVSIGNTGIDTLTFVDVVSDINGTLDTTRYNGSITTGDTAYLTLPAITINSGTVYDLKFYTIDPNGGVDGFNGDDTLSINGLTTGLQGTITLDTSLPASATNYTSFTSLANQLNLVGVCGNVTIDVASGTYNDVFALDNVTGLGDSSRLTIDGGDSALVTLENNLANDGALISFDATSYVTVKNMTLNSTNTGTGDHFGVHFTGASSYDSIVNCRILMNPANGFGAFGVGASADITNDFAEGDNANYVTVMNCAIDGGSYSVHFEGPATGNYNLGNAFINNTLTNMDDYGFYMDQQDSLRIIGNSVNGIRSNLGDGIACFDAMNFEVNANQVTVDDYGIYMTNANFNELADREASLINNMVISTADHGIYITNPIRLNVYHNTVYSEGGVSAFRLAGFSLIDSIDVRNNVFTSLSDIAFEMTGAADTTAFLRFDNNVFYTAGTGDLMDINGNTYASLAAYQTARPGFNINSLEGDPQFVSTRDLHIIGSFIDESGDNGVNILVDIDGDTRPSPNATFVDAGADEYTPPPCATPTNVRAFNPGLDSVTIALNGTSLDYEYEFLTGSQTQGSGIIGVINADSVRVGGLASSTSYGLYVRQVCRRGDTSPWIGPINFSTAYGIPYVQDFENFSSDIEENPWPEGWSSTTATDPNWISYNDANGTVFRSGGTGPLVDNTLGTINGTFIFMETSGGTVGDSADFVSPPIFIDDTLSVVELKYWYFNFGANIDRMEVIIDTNGVEEVIATYIGQQQTSQNDSWIQAKHLLSGYQGKSIQIKIRGFNVACCTGDLAVDDIEVVVPSPINGGVTDIVSPKSGCGLGSADSVEVEIVNSGSDTLSNFSVSYRLNGAAAVTETFAGTILSGDTANYVFSSTANLSAPGSYSIVSYTSIIGDGDTSNDSSEVFIENIPIITGFPYRQSFESGNGGWTSGGLNSTWALGAPANTIIDTASDGTQAWVTSLTGNYVSNEESWVQSPCLDFTNLSAPILELDAFWDIEFSWDGAVIQSSTDGGATWQKVGSFGDTVNWYNDNTINGLAGIEPSQEGWSGTNGSANGSNGWLTAKHSLSGLGGVSGVILRVVFGSDGSVVDEGFAFDNIVITDSVPRLDASISSLNSPVASPDSCYSSSEDVIVTLQNSGNTEIDFAIDSALVEVNITGAITQSLSLNITTNTLNGGLPLLGGNSIEVNLGTVNLTTAGIYNFESIVTITADTINNNDTLNNSLQINQISGGLISGADTICSGDSTTLTTSNYQGELQWQELVSGIWTDISGATGTAFTAAPTSFTEYRVLACGTAASDTLGVTSISFANGPNATGDTIVVACGSPGTAIATASSSNTNPMFIWYNAQTGGSIIDTTQAAYSLNAAGDQMSYTTGTTISGTPAVDTLWVSEMVSTGSVRCESPRTAAIVMVDCITGLEGTAVLKNALSIYPNPSDGIFKLNISTAAQTNYNLLMRDVNGKVVYTNDVVVNGNFQDQLDFSSLAKGVYYLQVKTPKAIEVKKLIIQ